MAEPDLTVIFRPRNEWRGELIAQHLRDNDITAHLTNRASVGLWGNGSMALASLEILVPTPQADHARELLDEYLSEDEG